MTFRRVVVVSWLLFASLARAQAPEPPPEAGDGDYTLEVADTLAQDELEVGVGASRDGALARRLQHVRMQGEGVQASWREGDVLAGGGMRAPFAGGVLSAGRLAPRWARGLLLGGADEPWRAVALDRGEHATFRGRAGEGVAFTRASGEALVGRFAAAPLAAARVTWRD